MNERRRKEALPFSLSLSTESPMVFCLLRELLEGPKGDWGTKLGDPKESRIEELTGTWEREDFTLVFTRVLVAKDCASSSPAVGEPILLVSSKITNCF